MNMNNLENIIFEGKMLDLSTLSINQLIEILETINHKQNIVKQEIDTILENVS